MVRDPSERLTPQSVQRLVGTLGRPGSRWVCGEWFGHAESSSALQ